MKKFWYVFNPSRKGPSQKHEELSIAIGEATRLANQHGGTFYILEAIGVIKAVPKEIVIEHITLED